MRAGGQVPTLVITYNYNFNLEDPPHLSTRLRLVEGLAGHQKVGVGGHDEQAFERRVLDEALALTKALAIHHHPHHIAERLQDSVAAVHLSRGSSHYQVLEHSATWHHGLKRAELPVPNDPLDPLVILRPLVVLDGL